MRLQGLVPEVNDNRTQKPTEQQHSSLDSALSKFASAFKAGGDQRDPFGDAIALQDFNSQLDDLASALKSDRNAYDEATRAIRGAELELAAANKLVARSINDKIPDSLTIKRCQNEVTALEVELGSIEKRLKIAHENWQMVDREATHVNSKLGVLNGRLRQELELAQQAVEVLGRAAEQVYEAANWRGSYNIVVVGNWGAEELATARERLADGDYVRSAQLSKLAKQSSTNALEAAKQQVARHRRKLARKAAEARRRRQSRSSAHHFGSSSFGSSRSRSSSSIGRSSSSRSFSRSSSSGRSSGFSRSKW
jgi:hypothetical protein